MTAQVADKNQINTAFHEAGNCIAAIEIGFKFDYATIKNLTPAETAFVKKHIFVSLAGGVVDRQRGCFSATVVEQDSSVAVDLALILTNGDSEKASQYIDRTISRLSKDLLVGESWRNIERIAGKLIGEKKLSYEEVLFIVNKPKEKAVKKKNKKG